MKAAKPCPSMVSRGVLAGFHVRDLLSRTKSRPICRNTISHLYIDTISACKVAKVFLPQGTLAQRSGTMQGRRSRPPLTLAAGANPAKP